MEGCARGAEELLYDPAAGPVRDAPGDVTTCRSSDARHPPVVSLGTVVWINMEQAVFTVILCGGTGKKIL